MNYNIRTYVLFCLIVTTINFRNAFCMEAPHTPKQPALKGYFPTPPRASIAVTNYCKQLLCAIQENDEDDIAAAFEHFFEKNPYTMHNMNSVGEDYYNELFYKSFAAVICHCIEQCAYSPNRKGTPYTVTAKKTRRQPYDLLYLPLAYHNRVYVIQFCVSNESINPTFYCYKTKNSKKDPTVISINIVLQDNRFEQVKVRRLTNDGTCGTKIINPLPLEEFEDDVLYNENHFYKNTLLNISNTFDLSAILFDLYTAIPATWHVPREKYYQALLANALTFIGSGLTRTEVATTGGRADFILDRHLDTPVIFELKRNGSARAALEQIKGRKYTTITDTDTEMVGVNIRYNQGEPLDDKDYGDLEVSCCYEHYTQPRITLKNATPAQPKAKSRFYNTDV